MFSEYAAGPYLSQSIEEYVTASILAGVKAGTIKLPWWVPTFSSTLTVMAALTDGVKKYNALHAEIIGEIDFSMPARLSPAQLARIDMTFDAFLEANGLQAISSFLQFAHAAQGYGYVKTIPAFYGLWWVTPELLNGYIQMSLHEKIEEALHTNTNNAFMKTLLRQVATTLVGGQAGSVHRTTTMLPEGYGKLWQTIAAKDELDVRFGVNITDGGIDRRLADPTAKVRVSYTQEQQQKQDEFDFLIYTPAFADSHRYVKDLTSQEQGIFNQLSSFVLSTTLYQGDALAAYSNPGGKNLPIMYDPDKMSDTTADGAWYADRHDPLIFGGASFGASKLYRNQTRVAYQFYESPGKADPALALTDRSPEARGRERWYQSRPVLDKLNREFARRKQGRTTAIEQFAWPYFHHFSQSAITQGAPWDLLEMQGSSKTWWLGASASFESVHDVTNYNLMLIEQQLELKLPKPGDGVRSRRLRAEAARRRR